MALTNTGLEIKRYDDLLEELKTRLESELGTDIDLSSDSLLGIITSIYTFSLADQWSLAEAVYSAFDINTAEGKQLDDLVALVGIKRLPASPTNGNIEFTGDEGTVIPPSTTVSDNSGNSYVTTTQFTLDASGSTYVEIGVGSVLDSTDYVVFVDTDSFIYNSGIGATAESIVLGLSNAIGTQSNYTVTIGSNSDILILDTVVALDTIDVSVSDELNIIEVTNLGFVQNTENGAIPAKVNTIVNINTPISGLNSVINPVALTLGRERETDEELRIRHKDSVEIAGTATVPAIEGTLGQVQGVTTSFVVENRTYVTDSQGRPPKSYECIVEGGADQDIADAIWESKPAGIETYGTELVLVTDNQGNSQAVRFTRPIPVYLWARITYTKYDEETFPSDGEDTMKEALDTHISGLDLGEDAIPKRSYGSIYSAVSGIEDLLVEYAVTDDPNTPPVSYSTATVSIEVNERANIDLNRISVVFTP